MKLIVDASNVFEGGGLTYLVELLRHGEPGEAGITEVELWAPEATLDRLPDRPWLDKRTHRRLNGGYLARLLWMRRVFPRRAAEADVVFVPSSGWYNCEKPVVTMCQNLLPLEMEEIEKFFRGGAWKSGLRLLLLRRRHLHAFRQADGVIYLNDYCRDKVGSLIAGEGRCLANTAVIPHGVHGQFRHRRESYEFNRPFELLYVSRVNFYKYQWVIAEAAARLHAEGLPLRLRLVGEPYNQSAEKLRETIRRFPVLEEMLTWDHRVPYGELPEVYRSADAYLYGSTCETFGMTLLEAMASGLPIACSDASSMRGMLQDGGIYYDARSVEACMEAIRRLYGDAHLRRRLGERAGELAASYRWEETAQKTFEYLAGFGRR
ncbi:MAG: glycosyltransferase family 1 protein [Balneolaceae bacterium]|nr:glycosyltransferase family 1 protein [Balneolaceae bacterium]